MAWTGSVWKLPVSSGLLLACAYFAAPPLVPNFVAFIPMLAWIDASRQRSTGEVARAGLIFGLTTNLVILHWMYAMLDFSWLAFPLYVLLAFGFAAFAALAVVAARWLRIAAGWSFAVILPAVWIPLEWARSHGDLRMTADHLAHTLAPYPFLVQFADLTGPYGVGIFMLAMNALLYEASVQVAGEHRRRAAAALAIVLVAVLGYDAWSWWRPRPADRTVRVGLVQPNVPLLVKRALDNEASQWKTLDRMTREAAARGAQVVFWPETARPWPIQHFIERPPSYEMPEVQSLVREIRVAIVAGVEYYRIRSTRGRLESQLYNAAVVVQPDASLDPTWSAKTYLVPFVEGLPLKPVLGRFLEGREWLGGGFTPGPDAEVLRPRGERVGVLICYEELYPDLTRRLRNAGADLMAVLTNDAWFGKTVFQRYQADTLRLRAIENRCAFVRVANTGISGFVDPLGRYRGRTGLFELATEVDDVAVMPTRTVYDRFGDYPVGLAFGSFVVTAVVARRRRHRGGTGNDVATRRDDMGSIPGAGPVED